MSTENSRSSATTVAQAGELELELYAFERISLDLPSCFVVQTNSLAVRQSAVNCFVFRGVQIAGNSHLGKHLTPGITHERSLEPTIYQYSSEQIAISTCVADISA